MTLLLLLLCDIPGGGLLPGFGRTRRRGLFIPALRRFLLLLLGLLLDSGKLAQDLLPFFCRFPTPCKLHAEYLLDDGIKFRPARIAEGFKFVPYRWESAANRPPFVQVRADFRKGC